MDNPLPFNPDPNLILQHPPPPDPTWLAHEKSANLLSVPSISDPKASREAYSQECKARNAHLLSGRDKRLSQGIKVHDTFIETGLDANVLEYQPNPTIGRKIPIRCYNPSSPPSGPPHAYAHSGKSDVDSKDIVVYYHGGGLQDGDLNAEDLTCRRICKDLGCTVYSCDYRLMPEHTADDACSDALQAFEGIVRMRKARRLVLVGNSSGGQLAAMVAGSYGRSHGISSSASGRGALRPANSRIHGVLLRGPVTCNPSDDGADIPSRFRPFHTSVQPAFHTSLASRPAVNASNRTTKVLPLEDEDLSKLPRHWIQVSTNDIYYSDGVLYAEALREAGVEVKLDVVPGFPHIFWLKAPELERAVKAEKDMLEGLRWLLESDGVVEEQNSPEQKSPGEVEGANFVPFTDEEFEKKFVDS